MYHLSVCVCACVCVTVCFHEGSVCGPPYCLKASAELVGVQISPSLSPSFSISLHQSLSLILSLTDSQSLALHLTFSSRIQGGSSLRLLTTPHPSLCLSLSV